MSLPFSSSPAATPKTTTISTMTTPVTSRSTTSHLHLLLSTSSWARVPRRASQWRKRCLCFIADSCCRGLCSQIRRPERRRNARVYFSSCLFSPHATRSPTAKQTKIDTSSVHSFPTSSVISLSPSPHPSSLSVYAISNKMETSSIARGSEAASKQKSMAAVYLGFFLASSSYMVVSATPAPAPQSQSPPNAVSKAFGRLAAQPVDPAAVTAPPATNPPTTIPITTNPISSTRPTTIATSEPAKQPTQSTAPPVVSTTVPTTTTTLTTSTSSSEIVSTVSRSVSDSVLPSSSQGIYPSETPYGMIQDNNTNGGMMLIVSLVVVFVVLAGMGLVVCCLFRRRNAKKRRLHLFGGGSGKASNLTSSSSGLDNILAAAAAGHPRDVNGPGDSAGGLHIPVGGATGGALQEMTELHQNALLSRKSSTLSMRSNIQGPGHGPGGSHQGTHMLSPVLAATRPYSQTSGHWSGSSNNYGPTDYIPSDPGSMDHPSSAQVRDFRNNQYDEYYGVTPPQPLYSMEGGSGSGVGGSSSGYSSNEQLLHPHHPHHPHPALHHSGHSSLNLSRRSSLSLGLYPQQDILHGSSPLFRSKTLSIASGGAYQQNLYYGSGSSSASPIFHGDPGLPTAVYGVEDSFGSERSGPVPEPLLAAQGEHSLMRPKSMSLLYGPALPHADLRPSSMVTPGNASIPPSSLTIPPSITTRPRSMMNPSAIYASQSQSQGQGQAPFQGQYQQQHPHPYYQQQQQRYYPTHQDYFYQQYPASPAMYPGSHDTLMMFHEAAVVEDDGNHGTAVGVGSSSGFRSGGGVGSVSDARADSQQLMSKDVGERRPESPSMTHSSPGHTALVATVPEPNSASTTDDSA